MRAHAHAHAHAHASRSWGEEIRAIGYETGVVTLGQDSAYAHGLPPTAAASVSPAAAYAVSKVLCDPAASSAEVYLFALCLFLTERCGLHGALAREDDGGAYFEALEVEVARQLVEEQTTGRVPAHGTAGVPNAGDADTSAVGGPRGRGRQDAGSVLGPGIGIGLGPAGVGASAVGLQVGHHDNDDY